MLTCITCCKQEDDGSDEGEQRSPSTKEFVKKLTTQMKDFALKVSCSSKSTRPISPSSYRRESHRPFPGSSSSNPGGQSTPAAVEVVVEDDDEPKDWIAQVEPGVQITLIALPQGGNFLKRIRFSTDVYNKLEANRWWMENSDRMMELYNIQRFDRRAPDTPARLENEVNSSYSMVGSAMGSPRMAPSTSIYHGRDIYKPSGSRVNITSEIQEEDGDIQFNAGPSAYGVGRSKMGMSSMGASSSSRDEGSIFTSNANEIESEWIEEDEPGVYLIIRQLADGTRELRDVRFSREKFGEVHSRLWLEANKDRILSQYLN